MKTTFFAILASAAVVLASPLPEAEANAHSGQAPQSYDPAPVPSYGGGQGGQPQWGSGGGQPQWPAQGGHGGQWPGQGPPPTSYNGAPPHYPNDPPAYYPAQSGDIQGSIIQGGNGGQGGSWAPGPQPGWGSGGSGGGSYEYTYWTNQGLPPAPQYGYQEWPTTGNWPQGSHFNTVDGGVNSIGNTCSNSQQAVSCCNGDNGGDSSGLLSGLLGNVLPSTCTLDLLSPSCNQKVSCCDTQTQNGLVNIGLQCSSVLG